MGKERLKTEGAGDGAGRAGRIGPFAALCAVALFLAAHVGGVLHESDQAALLSGARQLARGEASAVGAPLYRYDNYYLTYRLLALALRAAPRADPVAVGNALSFSLFWIPLLALAAHLARRSRFAAVGLLAVGLSPAVLVHSSFLAPNFVSAGFLFGALLARGIGERRRSRGARALAAPLLFAAAAARSDAALLAPLFVWSYAPRARLGAAFRAGRTWAFAIALAGAVGLGAALRGGASPGVFTPLWRPAAAAAYTVFGLGAAGGLLLAALYALSRAAARSRRQRGFAVFGLLALLLPFVFYAAQLCSTRHWMAGLQALTVLLAARRGRRWLRCAAGPAARRRGGAALAAAALLPLIVGLRLPFRGAPRVCAGDPTYLPSADGLVPMGALLWNARERRPAGAAHDHNHRLWLAARSVARWPEDASGRVPVLATPMREILALAVRGAGQTPRFVAPDRPDAPFWCADLRALLRVAPSSTSRAMEDWRSAADGRRLVRLGGDALPYLIVFAEPGAPDAEQAEWLALAARFGWREFLFVSPEAPAVPRGRREGHTAVWIADAPFELRLLGGGEERRIASSALGVGGLHALRLSGAERRGRTVADIPAAARAAATVWPDHFTADSGP